MPLFAFNIYKVINIYTTTNIYICSQISNIRDAL